MSMTKTHAEPIDIRHLSAIPAVAGFLLMGTSFLAPGLLGGFFVSRFGIGGILIQGVLVFAILRFNYVPCLWLVRLFYRKETRGSGGHVAVEMERLDTYQKFKLVPDDFGVLFVQDGDVFLRRNRSLYALGETAKPKNLRIFRHNGRPRGLVWRDEIAQVDYILRPVIFLWDFTLTGDFKRRVDILVMTLMRWTRDATAPQEMPLPERPQVASPKPSTETVAAVDRTPYSAPDSFR